MTVWTTLDPLDFDIGTAVDYETFRALIRNCQAIAEGSSGAPRIEVRAMAIGGSGADGSAINATTPANPGYYEYDDIVWTSPRTLPWFSVIRCRGDANITGAITVDYVTENAEANTTPLGGTFSPPGENLFPLGVLQMPQGRSSSTADAGGGGGSIGSGGTGFGAGGEGGYGLKKYGSAFNRLWASLAKRPFVGGQGGEFTGSTSDGGKGGGALVLIVQGDLTIGANISAVGEAGQDQYAGGGGGGCIVIICTGTITYTGSPTISVKGGNGNTTTDDGGNGGAGYIGLVAPTHTGTVTLDATINTNGSGGDGEAGISEQVTLAENYINGLLLR
jgi:hypothetical protein